MLSSVMWRCMSLVRTDVSGNDVLLVTANVIPSLLSLPTLKLEPTRSSETLVTTRSTRSHVREHGTLHNHRRGNLKFYIALTGWAL
jgi:hypothetical protein